MSCLAETPYVGEANAIGVVLYEKIDKCELSGYHNDHKNSPSTQTWLTFYNEGDGSWHEYVV